ncbi:MAG: FHA domain-containing protein, partial [Candidatus Heimdallarchaeota archaeon]|nr:FHA domain-containing protein [Candidatus Heimdallarchaeota archaeon]
MEKLTIAQNTEEPIPELRVNVIRGEAIKNQSEYSESFIIGRDETCAIQFDEEVVSRFHARVQVENGKWWIEDSGSTNGTYQNNQKITRIQLTPEMEIEFGKNGPVIQFQFSQSESSLPDPHSVTH